MLAVLTGRLSASFPWELASLRQHTKLAANPSKRRQNSNGRMAPILIYFFSSTMKALQIRKRVYVLRCWLDL